MINHTDEPLGSFPVHHVTNQILGLNLLVNPVVAYSDDNSVDIAFKSDGFDFSIIILPYKGPEDRHFPVKLDERVFKGQKVDPWYNDEYNCFLMRADADGRLEHNYLTQVAHWLRNAGVITESTLKQIEHEVY
jgi:hypothetical protein